MIANGDANIPKLTDEANAVDGLQVYSGHLTKKNGKDRKEVTFTMAGLSSSYVIYGEHHTQKQKESDVKLTLLPDESRTYTRL